MIRFVDIILATFILLCGVLPMIAITIAIWLYDGGPAFFYQIRVGRNLKPFKIVKFRSMRVNRDGIGAGSAQGGDLAAKQAARAAFKTTTPDDPRITPIGRLIRATHLDELPQLINVLKGEMSLVGVRPDTPAQEVDYNPDYWQARHRLRPGITGPAQIGARGGGMEERTHLEKQWLANPSLGKYLWALYGTVGKVWRRSSF